MDVLSFVRRTQPTKAPVRFVVRVTIIVMDIVASLGFDVCNTNLVDVRSIDNQKIKQVPEVEIWLLAWTDAIHIGIRQFEPSQVIGQSVEMFVTAVLVDLLTGKHSIS